MSYFEDQYDAWMENGCRGSLEDTDPYDIPDDKKENKDMKNDKAADAMIEECKKRFKD